MLVFLAFLILSKKMTISVKNTASVKYIDDSFKNSGLKVTSDMKSSLCLATFLYFIKVIMKTGSEENAAINILPNINEGKAQDKNSKRNPLCTTLISLPLKSAYSL